MFYEGTISDYNQHTFVEHNFIIITIGLEPNSIFYVTNKNRKKNCIFVQVVSHKAGLFQFNHKLNQDASRRRDSVNICPEAQAVEDVFDQHDDIKAVSGLRICEVFRRKIKQYVVRAKDNVMDHVSGLSDGVIEFLTNSDPDSIGNRTMN